MGLLEVLLPAAYTAICIYIIKKTGFFKIPSITSNYLVGLFLLKVASGLILYFIYSYHYTYRATSDAFRYYDDAVIMVKALKTAPLDYFKMLTGIGAGQEHLQKYYNEMANWIKSYNYNLYNDNRTVIRFNALVYPFSGGIYHVHTVIMCFLSFTGLVGIFKVFEKLVAGKTVELILVIFLVPSVIFWSSGVLKEGLIMFALGLLFYNFFQFLQGPKKASGLFTILICTFILLLCKFYVLIAALPAFLASAWFMADPKKPVLKHILSLLFCGLLVISVSLVSEKYNAFEIMQSKQKDFINLAKGGTYLINVVNRDTVHLKTDHYNRLVQEPDSLLSIKEGTMVYKIRQGNIIDSATVSRTEKFIMLMHLEEAGSTINIQRLGPNAESFIKASPQALFNTFMRPHIFEANSALMKVSALENIGILMVILLTLSFLKKPGLPELNLICFSISFTIILAILVGLITPVMGAIVRYKIPFISFLLSACILAFNKDKFLQTVNLIFKKRRK